jgi:hypothetical protein
MKACIFYCCKNAKYALIFTHFYFVFLDYYLLLTMKNLFWQTRCFPVSNPDEQSSSWQGMRIRYKSVQIKVVNLLALAFSKDRNSEKRFFYDILSAKKWTISNWLICFFLITKQYFLSGEKVYPILSESLASNLALWCCIFFVSKILLKVVISCRWGC